MHGTTAKQFLHLQKMEDSNFLLPSTKRTHSHVPGLKGEALFLEQSFYIVSANRRLVQICILICIIQTCTR